MQGVSWIGCPMQSIPWFGHERPVMGTQRFGLAMMVDTVTVFKCYVVPLLPG